MNSSDEIAVATPSRRLRSSTMNAPATAPKTAAAHGKARQTRSRKALAYSNKTSTTASGGVGNLSSPLSDVDEVVLEKAPVVQLEQSGSERLTPTTSSQLASSSPADSSSPDVLINSSPPEAPSSGRSTGKRARPANDTTNTSEPPAKRRSTRAVRTSAVADTMSLEDQNKDLEDELALPSFDVSPKLQVSGPHMTSNVDGDESVKRLPKISARRAAVKDVSDDSKRPTRKTAEKPERKREKYEPLRLYKASNWVLFDPIKSSSPSPPKFLTPFTHYKFTSKKILEYNLHSGSVRLKRTPSKLKGKNVVYGKSGPRLA